MSDDKSRERLTAIELAIAHALYETRINPGSISKLVQDGNTTKFQIYANGRSVSELFTNDEILDAASGSNGMAVAGRIRRIATEIAGR